MKRILDVIFSLACIIFSIPLCLIAVVLMRLESKGGIFFMHRRIGKGFKPFNLYKLRTTREDATGKRSSFSHEDDPRTTKVGRFLRKSGIDELPQLVNVLKGDMSLVGPRPEARKYVTKFRADYREILKVRPGIWDIALLTYGNEEAKLKGKDNPEEYYIHVLLPERIKFAREYVKKTSVSYDLKLIFFAIFKFLYPQNIIITAIDRMTPYRRPIVIGLQLIIFAVSNYLAFFIRFDARISPSYLDLFLKYLPLVLFFRLIFLFGFSLDKGIWRYASIRDLLNIIAAITLGSLASLLVIRQLYGEIGYPRSIYVIDWFINIFLLWGIRLFRRLHERANTRQNIKKKVIVIGAGDAAEMLIRDVEHSPNYPYRILGLIDIDPSKSGLKIRNVPILGMLKDINKIVEKEEPEEFLIAIPSAAPSKLRSVVKDLRQFGIPIKMLPGLWGILNGTDTLDKIKVVEPEDVLFRAPVYTESKALKNFIRGKRVMITGAGGSIGSELSRQIASFSPEKLILFERHEESLYKIDMELKNNYEHVAGVKNAEIHSVIGDILNGKRVYHVMEKFRPHFVFHAAAYKHVPLMEDNAYEAFRTNVLGTKMLAETARQFQVERFILISTDKAVDPVNVMGMTKKIAEEILHYLMASQPSGIPDFTKYITVRFGNVLESSGSVVPLFKDQIKRGGPVTVTHPEITRYFMTIPEAVTLVLQAAAMGMGGEVLVLDMGKPVKILDLAKRMISLYGYRPGSDIEIVFTGLRPGEKLYEELFNSHEIIKKTAHPKINMAVSNGSIDHSKFAYLNDIDIKDPADIKAELLRLTGLTEEVV